MTTPQTGLASSATLRSLNSTPRNWNSRLRIWTFSCFRCGRHFSATRAYAPLRPSRRVSVAARPALAVNAPGLVCGGHKTRRMTLGSTTPEPHEPAGRWRRASIGRARRRRARRVWNAVGGGAVGLGLVVPGPVVIIEPGELGLAGRGRCFCRMLCRPSLPPAGKALLPVGPQTFQMPPGDEWHGGS